MTTMTRRMFTGNHRSCGMYSASVSRLVCDCTELQDRGFGWCFFGAGEGEEFFFGFLGGFLVFHMGLFVFAHIVKLYLSGIISRKLTATCTNS